MKRPVLTRFEKYIKEMNKEQLQKVVAAACRYDVCIFNHNNEVIVCSNNMVELRCDICPYKDEADCYDIMIKDLMNVDMLEVIG